MPEINKKSHSRGLAVWLILLPIVDFLLLIKVLLHNKNIALFNTKGYIAEQQHGLIVFTISLLLVVIVPTIFLFYYTAWTYRETNTKAIHNPDARHGRFLILAIWLIPTMVAIILASVMWPATHKLAPQKLIAANVKPLTIQVISMRWKWLFIYPEQKIATVNYVQIPLNTPVQFELTADDAPMSSFWIPNLGGQLYSMTGMVNNLNLMGDTPGDYPGSSAEINGSGFAGMKFTARVSTQEDFDLWTQSVQQSPDVLNDAAYAQLLKPSENNPLAVYANADSSLYDKVLMKYMGPSDSHMNHEMYSQ
jgi:cytochrome o ubiquinol oxidase subunit 2